MDAQIAHRLQVEHAKKQATHRHNRQHPSFGQVRSNRNSGYNQTDRELKSKHIGRQSISDRYP